jgi:hypothetical protein
MVVGGGILLRMATRASYEMTLLAYRFEGQSALQILLRHSQSRPSPASLAVSPSPGLAVEQT